MLSQRTAHERMHAEFAERGCRSQVSQKVIADSIDLSTATVSRALRGDRSIPAHTRERVVNAARRLGYQLPTPARPGAQAMKTLQLFVGAATGPSSIADELMAGISHAASQLDAQLSVFVLPDPVGDDPAAHSPALSAGIVDAAILLHQVPSAIASSLAGEMPVVSIVQRHRGVDCIDVNQPAAVADLVRRLHAAGHRRIGFVGEAATASWQDARRQGFRIGGDELQLPAADTPLLLPTNPAQPLEQIADAMEADIRAGVKAWVCVRDALAYELCSLLLRRGYDIGNDVVLAGFDGHQPPHGLPQLPGVRVPYAELGRAAVHQSLHRLQFPDARPREILLQHEVVLVTEQPRLR